MLNLTFLKSFNLILPSLMFLISCLVFMYKRKHLLINLLTLEFMVLLLFFFFFFFLSLNLISMYMLMGFLVFSVCEGALGLSILVSMIRTHGNNYFQSFSSLMC